MFITVEIHKIDRTVVKTQVMVTGYGGSYQSSVSTSSNSSRRKASTSIPMTGLWSLLLVSKECKTPSADTAS